MFTHFYSEGVEEREETRTLSLWSFKQDADPEVHERFGEVYNLLPEVVDGERCYSKISFLKKMK